MAPGNEVKIVVRAVDKASKPLQGIMGKFSALRLPAIAAAGAVAGIGFSAIKMAADFDKAFGEVTTLFDAPKAQIAELRSDIKDLARAEGVDAVKATKAMYQAISAGVKPAQVIGFLKDNIKLAVGGVTELSTAVDLTTTVMNAWGLEQKELTNVSDAMFTAVRLGKTTIDELGAAMFNVAPVAGAMGVSVDEVAAALAVLTAKGVPTAVATTQLRQAILALAAPTKRQKKEMDELGLSFDAAKIEALGIDEVFRQLIEATGGNDEQLRRLVGSTEALQAVLALGSEGGAEFAAALDEMKNKSGSTDVAFTKMNETFSRQFDILKGQLKGILLDIGEQVLPSLIDALQRLNPWLQEKIPAAIETMKQKWIEIKPEVIAFADIVFDVMQSIQERIELAVAIFEDIWKVFHGALTLDFKEAWSGLKGIVFDALEGMRLNIEDQLKGFALMFGVSFDGIGRTINDSMVRAINGVLETVEFGLNAILKKIGDKLGSISSVMSFFRIPGSGALGGLADTLSGGISIGRLDPRSGAIGADPIFGPFRTHPATPDNLLGFDPVTGTGGGGTGGGGGGGGGGFDLSTGIGSGIVTSIADQTAAQEKWNQAIVDAINENGISLDYFGNLEGALDSANLRLADLTADQATIQTDAFRASIADLAAGFGVSQSAINDLLAQMLNGSLDVKDILGIIQSDFEGVADFLENHLAEEMARAFGSLDAPFSDVVDFLKDFLAGLVPLPDLLEALRTNFASLGDAVADAIETIQVSVLSASQRVRAAQQAVGGPHPGGINPNSLKFQPGGFSEDRIRAGVYARLIAQGVPAHHARALADNVTVSDAGRVGNLPASISRGRVQGTFQDTRWLQLLQATSGTSDFNGGPNALSRYPNQNIYIQNLNLSGSLRQTLAQIGASI